MPISIFIDARLTWFLRLSGRFSCQKTDENSLLITYDGNRRTSIKDLLESFGIPHTAIYFIKAKGIKITFEYIVKPDDYLEVYGFDIPIDFSRDPSLRPALHLNDYRFVADANVGRLAKLLRMVGLDVAYKPTFHDKDIADIAHKEKRIVLTKDIRLLMRKKILYGYAVKAVMPKDQLIEIVNIFALRNSLKFFSRCMLCNALLTPVEKDVILHRLEPLTKKFYDKFFICPHCNKIYWAGSHRSHMEGLLNSLPL